jgi:hypothetical protein
MMSATTGEAIGGGWLEISCAGSARWINESENAGKVRCQVSSTPTVSDNTVSSTPSESARIRPQPQHAVFKGRA